MDNKPDQLNDLQIESLKKLNILLKEINISTNDTQRKVDFIISDTHFNLFCVQICYYFWININTAVKMKLNSLTIQVILDLMVDSNLEELKGILHETRDDIQSILVPSIFFEDCNVKNIDVLTFIEVIHKLNDKEIVDFFLNPLIQKQIDFYSNRFPYSENQENSIKNYCIERQYSKKMLNILSVHLPLMNQIINSSPELSNRAWFPQN